MRHSSMPLFQRLPKFAAGSYLLVCTLPFSKKGAFNAVLNHSLHVNVLTGQVIKSIWLRKFLSLWEVTRLWFEEIGSDKTQNEAGIGKQESKPGEIKR